MEQGSTILLTEHVQDVEREYESPPLLYAVSCITVFSAVGVVIRKYSTFEDSFLPGYIYPQLVGCFLMGIVTNNHLHPLLKLGLQTGLCGSITSFSTFILETYMYFYTNIWNVFASIIVVSGLCFAAFRVGSHVRVPSFPKVPRLWRLLGLAIYPATVILFSFLVSLSLGLAIAIGPVGSLVRWYFSHWNRSDFPLGTFFANCIGVLLVSLLKMSESQLRNNSLGCAWVTALEFGFIGCLSTVSSFVAELDKLDIRHSYAYYFSSILVGLVLASLVLGLFTVTGKEILDCQGNQIMNAWNHRIFSAK
jgi:fluoride ion exporter CrcB/FEX